MTPSPQTIHYLSLTRDHIDAQIEALRERRADIDIEIQRINRRLPEIPVLRKIEKRCVEVSSGNL